MHITGRDRRLGEGRRPTHPYMYTGYMYTGYMYTGYMYTGCMYTGYMYTGYMHACTHAHAHAQVRDFPSIYADYVNPATRRFSGGENGGYVVCAGSLAFSVTVFAVCAVITITTIIARRYCFSPSAELGGPQRSARLTSAFFILLWLVYIVFSIIRDLEVVPSWTYIKGLSTEGSCP